jgi:hypothetical protein
LSCYFNGRWGTNYFADIIELKTGIKTRLGNASTGNPSTGNPSSVMKMGVDNGNSGIADYNLGFEVEVLKSLMGIQLEILIFCFDYGMILSLIYCYEFFF